VAPSARRWRGRCATARCRWRSGGALLDWVRRAATTRPRRTATASFRTARRPPWSAQSAGRSRRCATRKAAAAWRRGDGNPGGLGGDGAVRGWVSGVVKGEARRVRCWRRCCRSRSRGRPRSPTSIGTGPAAALRRGRAGAPGAGPRSVYAYWEVSPIPTRAWRRGARLASPAGGSSPPASATGEYWLEADPGARLSVERRTRAAASARSAPAETPREAERAERGARGRSPSPPPRRDCLVLSERKSVVCRHLPPTAGQPRRSQRPAGGGGAPSAAAGSPPSPGSAVTAPASRRRCRLPRRRRAVTRDTGRGAWRLSNQASARPPVSRSSPRRGLR
jgi:hypothetical protein